MSRIPPVTWPYRPTTFDQLDSEAGHIHVYLVLGTSGPSGTMPVGWSGTDRDRAHEYARNVGGVVARIPVVGDYRSEETP